MQEPRPCAAPSRRRRAVASFRNRFLLPPLAASLLLSAPLLPLSPAHGAEGVRRAEVKLDVRLPAPAEAKRVRLWLPYPVSDESQDVTDVRVEGNPSVTAVYREGKGGNTILYAEWSGPAKERTLSYSFRVVRRELRTPPGAAGEDVPSGEEFARWVVPPGRGSAPAAAKELAERITKGKGTNLEKARAIYDWTVENMRRDPDVKGCGAGEVEPLLSKLGGKCADIHSVFVALCRGAGVPAREVFGIRIPKGAEGTMTKAQHCWAEFHQPGAGWIVVDPADVRKAVLERKISLEEAKPLREYYFGAVDGSRIAYGTGRDLLLNPPQDGPPLNYFMYPYAEADGKALGEDLYGFDLGYAITFREL